MTGDRATHGEGSDLQAAAVLRDRWPWLVRGFGRYARWYVGRAFNGLLLARDGVPSLPAGRPAIVYANHPSWWDPLVFMLLGHHLFAGRPGYGPMDAKMLERYSFMRRLGIFGVETGTAAGAVRFLRIGRAVLARPDAMLWVTAQGRFTDVRERPVALLPGVAFLAKNLPDAVVLPLALEYAFWNERTPMALARFGTPILDAKRLGQSARDINDVLALRLADTMDGLATLSRARDARRFTPIVEGSAGVGGVYDVWRRGCALARGRRFRPQHMDGEA